MASSKVMTSTNSNSRKPDQPRRVSSSSVTKAQSLSDHGRNTSAKANNLGSSSMTVDGLLRTVYDSNPSTTESTLLDAQITVMETPIPVPSDSHPNGSSHAPKTVDEVWNEIVSGDRKECKVEAPDEMMTLEDFLAKAGAVEEEDMKVVPSERLSGGVFAFDSVTPSPFAALDSVDGAIVGFGNGVDVIAGAGAGAGRGKRGRAVLEPLDKAAQQRQRRMIKNRESAARSRERKQAYQVELESIATRLEEENEQLLKEKDLEISNPSESTPPPLNFYYGDTSNDVEQYEDFVEDCQKPIMGSGETFELCHDEKLVDIPEQYEMDMKPIKDEFFVESSRIMKPSEVNYSLDEPYLDATDNPLLGDGFFLESDDLLNPVESDAAGFDILDEYLTFLNADDDMAFDPSEIMGGENSFSNQATHTQEHLNGGTEKVYIDGQQPSEAQGSNDASTSKQKPEAAIYESDIKNPFIKHATRMLGSIPAPPAYASEFPAKDVTLQLHSAAQSSSSVHVTTGVIRIRNTTLTSHGTDWLLGKNSDVNFGMPFLLPQGDTNSANFVPMAGLHAAGKTASVVSWGWFFLIFFWALILSVSFRFASNIYIK